ncbi:hypothetical protein NVP1123O_54 [Vibrio phage 1.123.O._10N.286.48.F3]|nr:hypothetical protein NVP1123O_54 [Vibrio phage 1.123.O._10N.286.48.F3]
MAHVVSGKLRKPPFIKEGVGQDGQSKMYAIELSEMTKDYQSGEKTYTNYKALFFAKTDGAKQFYDKAFEEGSFVVVACEKLKVDVSECGQYIRLGMENARLEGALTNEQQGAPAGGQNWGQPQQPNGGQPYNQNPQNGQQGGNWQQSSPQGQQQYTNIPPNFDGDVPF